MSRVRLFYNVKTEMSVFPTPCAISHATIPTGGNADHDERRAGHGFRLEHAFGRIAGS